MAVVKIVVIGASRVFAPTIVADLWHAREDLAGSTIALCDIDADTLGVTTRVVERMVTEQNMPYKIESSVRPPRPAAGRGLRHRRHRAGSPASVDHRPRHRRDTRHGPHHGRHRRPRRVVAGLAHRPAYPGHSRGHGRALSRRLALQLHQSHVRDLPHVGQDHQPQGRGVVPRHRGHHETPGAVSEPSGAGHLRARRRYQPPAVDSRSAPQRHGPLPGAQGCRAPTGKRAVGRELGPDGALRALPITRRSTCERVLSVVLPSKWQRAAAAGTVPL